MSKIEPSQRYSNILSKMERALRNGTGCQLSNSEIQAILQSPAWMQIVKHERAELIAAYCDGDE